MKFVIIHISKRNKKIAKFSLENKLNDVILTYCAEYISTPWVVFYTKKNNNKMSLDVCHLD